MRDAGAAPLAQACHLAPRAGLIQENEAARVEIRLKRKLRPTPHAATSARSCALTFGVSFFKADPVPTNEPVQYADRDLLARLFQKPGAQLLG